MLLVILILIFDLEYSFLYNKSKCGKCLWTVPDYNTPGILPLVAGFETRKLVDKIFKPVSNRNERLKITVLTLCELLHLSKDSIDPKIALLLSIETINGMSKTAPMTEQT